jgi:hypothetical protein
VESPCRGVRVGSLAGGVTNSDRDDYRILVSATSNGFQRRREAGEEYFARTAGAKPARIRRASDPHPHPPEEKGMASGRPTYEAPRETFRPIQDVETVSQMIPGRPVRSCEVQPKCTGSRARRSWACPPDDGESGFCN